MPRPGANMRLWTVEPSCSTSRVKTKTSGGTPSTAARSINSAREHEGGCDGRVAGHRELGAGGKDSHAPVVARVVGRQHEGRLRQIELFGDRLHRLGRQPTTVRDDGQRVPAERAIREHVNEVVV